ncbi:hypothetical protein BASA61_003003 [Batrachochytrium salamandrivorans]|nr:hypothetical protein BASA60_008274 [Batrachochytrium salamandrivorans]KAH6576381.1 hypothetical protein BASA62_001430 [Batrachochytrium salamandrivorans]KAH6597897.1 hypothetical protein BASA61_003003 [Batrachochytrium salamandrivorans]KAH9267824.1 hypothetical protein BASA84_000511 [Batrachochytrium salamandrivorans]KAJ1344127.1 hypothetical protein BSLG_001267 [Batrachochytrium salamandrivorans]
MANWPRAPVIAGQGVVGDRLSFGDRVLDDTFGGGLATGSVYELFGPASAGKTQLALQLALRVQMPLSAGGLDGGLYLGAMYISTDKNFPSGRLLELSRFLQTPSLSFVPKNKDRMTDRVYVLRVGDLETQRHLILYQLEQHMLQNNIRLVVVDSIANSMRIDAGSDIVELQERNQCMAEILTALKRLATQLCAVVLCVNQVCWKPDTKHNTSNSYIIRGKERIVASSDGMHEYLRRISHVRPTMSDVLSVYMNTSFFLDREAQGEYPLNESALRHIIVVYSPYLISGTECKLRIHKQGIIGEK